MQYLPGTQVKIIEHPSKQFVNKIGILGNEKPDAKKPGRFPVVIDDTGKTAWCQLDWLEVVTTDELPTNGDSAPEAMVEIVSAGDTTLNTNEDDSARPSICVDGGVIDIELSLLELDGGTQSRAGSDEATLAEYTEAWERGVKFPPVDLYYDGKSYWLSDGFHRCLSRQRAKLPGSTIAATIHQGTRRDAVLASVGANATHGLRRGNADKRRAVETLLRDEEWGQWSDNAIAKACGVSQPFVGKIRAEIFPTYNGYKSERKALDGRTLNTAKIGKAATPQKDEQTFSSVVEETNTKLNQLVKPLSAEQVGYDFERNEAPAQVDDRPFIGGAYTQAIPQVLAADDADGSVIDAIALSIDEYQQALEETELLKAERDDLKQRLAEANAVIDRLKQEVQELQRQSRMSA